MRHKIAKLNIARLLSMIMATVLLMTLLAALFVPCVYADETDGELEILPDYDPDADKIDWDSVATSGKCGEKLTWSYSGGTLTIDGEGAMKDFREPDMAPWYELRTVIYRVSLPEKITSIGSLAFYGCTKLRTITLPDKVTKIGSYAFAECAQLETAQLSHSLMNIGTAAFLNCKQLQNIRLPLNVRTIGNQAFYRCESLTIITLPSYIEEMGSSVFAYCKNLIRAEIAAELGALPDWTFYGCEHLTTVVLPKTVEAVNDYAFKQCEELTYVYHGGSAATRNEIKTGIEKDLPTFGRDGSVSAATPTETTTLYVYTSNGDGTATQGQTTVLQNDNMTVVSKVAHTLKEGTYAGGSYTANITVTVESKESWEETTTVVKDTLQEINEQYTLSGTEAKGTDVTIYLKSEDTVDKSFMEEMAGRDVKVTVVAQNGSEFRVECSELKKDELSGDYNYSYTVDSATKESQDKLGTDDCYKLTFVESAKINAEVVVPLPENKGNSNAFLYQVEDDGSHTRLQAVAVDNNGNAHFYLGAVDKDTEYVIGVDVPNETTDDVIIPDELFPSYGTTANAIARLEKIDYVITGRQSSWGVGIAQVTWILLAVLAGCIIVVGVVMAIWNKRRLERGYVPEIEYEVEE